jgi:hypothetical protein
VHGVSGVTAYKLDQSLRKMKLAEDCFHKHVVEAEIPPTYDSLPGIYVVRHTPQKEKNDTRVDDRHLHTQ